MSEPWERQRDEDGNLESNFWFDRFDRLYRPLGAERNLVAAYNAWRAEVGKGGRRHRIPTSWDNNSKRWHWKERAEAWDEAERQKRAVAEEQARAEMLQRHVKLATAMQGLGAKKLQKLQQDQALKELDAKEARLYVKDGTAIERTARGLPEYLVAVTEMTDDELVAQHAGLVAEVGGAGSGDEEAGDRAASDTDEESKQS